MTLFYVQFAILLFCGSRHGYIYSRDGLILPIYMHVDLCRSITIHRSNKLINKLGFGKRCNYNLIPEQPPSIPINRVTNCAIIIMFVYVTWLARELWQFTGPSAIAV